MEAHQILYGSPVRNAMQCTNTSCQGDKLGLSVKTVENPSLGSEEREALCLQVSTRNPSILLHNKMNSGEIMADIETWKSDSFEAKYRAMIAGMSQADQKKSAVQVLHLCQCSKCPTCAGSGETDLVFCTLGKSAIIHEQKGCLCSECAISKTMSLRWDYYCTHGSAVELSDL